MSTPLMPELPELPAQAAAWVIPGDDGGSMKEWVDAKHECDGEFTAPLFTADQLRDQLRAYGLAVWKAAMEHAAQAVPTNWLDPLLTGPRAVVGRPPFNCSDIELLLNAIAAEIRSLPLPESDMTQETK